MDTVAITVAIITILSGVVAIAGVAYKAGKKARKIRKNDQMLAEAHIQLHRDVKSVMKAVDAGDECSMASCPICSEAEVETDVKAKKIQTNQRL